MARTMRRLPNRMGRDFRIGWLALALPESIFSWLASNMRAVPTRLFRLARISLEVDAEVSQHDFKNKS
jgi:hypothetical protein